MNKQGKRAAVLLAIIACFLIAVPAWASAVTNNGVAAAVSTDQIPGWPQGPSTTSETAVLMDADTGAVLYDKGKDELRYPASITKLMTILLAVENSHLDEQVTFTETGIRDISPDSGNIGMQLGEIMTMEDCLYAAYIRSANEVCAQIAEYIGGTEANFIDMMNERAAEIGCTNTHFVNASGLPDDNHYSTAYDMALIMQEGLKNETFRKIIKAVNYSIPPTNMNGESRDLNTHILVLAPGSPLYYEGCIGGKSGLTIAAQNTLVTAAEREGVTYIAVTFRAVDLVYNSLDSRVMWDYGFQNFEHLDVNGRGMLTVPKGTGLDSLTMEESEVEGETMEQYFFQGQYVGQAAVETAIERPQPVVSESVVPEESSVTEEISDPAPEVQNSQQGLLDVYRIIIVVLAVLVLLSLVAVIITAIIKRHR